MSHRPLRALAVLLLLSASLAGCARPGADLDLLQAAPEPDASPVRFLSLGDAGNGDDAQTDNVRTMAEVCVRDGCDFAIYMGDNFYPAGVASVDDPLWSTHFETPWTAMDAVDPEFPVWAALGNHDESYAIGEGLDPSKGDNEVAYSSKEDRPSTKWHMPARWYDFTAGTHREPEGTMVPLVRFWAMDTNLESIGQGDGTQAAWLQDGLAGSDAVWDLAFGHHLYSSNSLHGQGAETHGYFANSVFFERFVQDAVCGRADFLMSGHDHILEWLHPRTGCPGTELLISGAGSTGREIVGDEPSHYTYGGGPGFAWHEVNATHMTVRFYHSGSPEPAWEGRVARADVGRSAAVHDDTQRPFDGLVFAGYAGGGNDAATQVRNSESLQRICSERQVASHLDHGDRTTETDCQMILHATGRYVSPHTPTAPHLSYERGQGLVRFFALDTLAPDLEAEARWLRHELADSTATWNVVYGRHPYHANGGPETNPAVRDLIQTTVCGAADFYFSGTARTLEYLSGLADCAGTDLVVMGSASAAEPIGHDRVPGTLFAVGQVGFWLFDASASSFSSEAFDADGTLLWSNHRAR